MSPAAICLQGQAGLVQTYPNSPLSHLPQTMLNNSAELDGGALSLSNGGIVAVEDEGCSSSCDLSRAGDGFCDPSCMNRGCNWYGTLSTRRQEGNF